MTPTSQPLVSVCIANYQGGSMLSDCIESVLRQDTDAAIEIIVHDDASSDDSLALLHARYPAVRTIPSSTNVGYCVANNRMAAAAQGTYLLLLNNDAALAPDAVRTFLSAGNEGAIMTLPQYDWTTGQIVDRGCLVDVLHVPVPNLDASRSDVGYAIGACLWVPRATWHDLGGFPEWFGSIAEDMFLCCSARLHGVAVRCLAESGYRHRQGATIGGNRASGGRLAPRYRRRHLSERNRIAVLVACTPTLLAWPWLAVHVGSLLMEALAICVAMRDLRPWRDIYAPALRDTRRNWRRLLGFRKAVQTGRQASLAAYLRGFTWHPRKLALLRRHGMPRVRD